MGDLNKPWYKKWWVKILFVVFTIIIVFAIAIGFLVLDTINNIRSQQSLSGLNLQTQNDPAKDQLIYGNNDNYWIGAANPKITIVEFADFGCHYCENAFPIIREISLKYQDSVKIVFRDYPVVTDYSINLAMAARCAGEQGLFWPMHDKLFLNQGVYEENDIIGLAKQIGVDEQRFQTCFDTNKYETKIKKDLADGEALGISGTPTWFINGAQISGDIPYDKFSQIIEILLNN